MKNIIEVPYFKQDRLNYDCGPLCIRMIESYFKGRRVSEKGYQKNILELAMDGNPKYCYGTSKKTMKWVIHQLSYHYRSIYGLKGLTWAIKKKRLPVIVLCHMIDEDRRKYEHYVVIKGIVNSYLHINDPYYGLRRVKINNFVAQRGNLFWKKRVQWGMVVSKRF